MDKSKFNVRVCNGYFIVGFLMYFINNYFDRKINIPVGEFAIMLAIIWQYYKYKSALNIPEAFVHLIFSVVLVVWCSCIDYMHNDNFYSSIRIFFRLFTLYVIIFLYILLPKKNEIIMYITGVITAHIVNFIVVCLYYLLVVKTNYYQLKYIIPTPSVVFLFYIFFNRNISKPIGVTCLSCLLLSVLSLPIIGGRGAFLSLFLALFFYYIYHLRLVSVRIMIVIALLIPSSTIIIIGFSGIDNVLNYLYELDYATISNVERTLMLDRSIDVMKESPLFGVSLSDFSRMYDEIFQELTNQNDTALSPHNFYMETAVPYGLFALAILLIIWRGIYKLIFRSVHLSGRKLPIAAYSCFSISWIMLYQPVAGITRLDFLLILIISLYGLSSENFRRYYSER